MTKLNTFLVALTMMVFALSCKKNPQKGPDSGQDAETREKKTALYKAKGYDYLFSVNRGQSDSLRPVFLGKTNTGEVKCIFGEYKNGTALNTAKVFNKNFAKWNLQGLYLANLKWKDNFSLDHKDFLICESAYNDKPYYYLEKNGLKPFNKWTTEIGDSLNVKYKFYKNLPILKTLNELYYRHETFSIYDPIIYTGGLFDYNDLSYLIYYKPRDPDDNSLWADMHLMIRSKNGEVFKRELYTNRLVIYKDGKLEAFIEGLNSRLIETGASDPVFVFWPDWNSYDQNMVAFWSSIRTDDIYNVKFPYPTWQMKFFSYKGQIFGNTKNELFKAEGKNPISIPVELKLDNIRGVFGNSRAILVAVENEEKGLDIVELKQ